MKLVQSFNLLGSRRRVGTWVRESVNNALTDMALKDETVVSKFGVNFSPTILSHMDSEKVPDLKRRSKSGVVNPFAVVAKEVDEMNSNIKSLLWNDVPVLTTVANYFFERHVGGSSGKKIRPTLVLLFSNILDTHKAEYNLVRNKHIRLAEITEMMHTASLLHDDVIDKAGTRRGIKSVNQKFGNKRAILAGDFLLARSSTQLASLNDIEVVKTLSTVLEHLVQGEILQMQTPTNKVTKSDILEYYLKKNYFKTGSLMANSILGTCMLAEANIETQQASFEFGECFGQAFQLIDDCLDYEGTEALGKPVLSDLKLGLVTAPILLSSKYSIGMDLSNFDDVLDIVHTGNGLQETKMLALRYVERAIQAAERLPQSESTDALVSLSHMILDRNK